jgi:hypothetical protein
MPVTWPVEELVPFDNGYPRTSGRPLNGLTDKSKVTGCELSQTDAELDNVAVGTKLEKIDTWSVPV